MIFLSCVRRGQRLKKICKIYRNIGKETRAEKFSARCLRLFPNVTLRHKHFVDAVFLYVNDHERSLGDMGRNFVHWSALYYDGMKTMTASIEKRDTVRTGKHADELVDIFTSMISGAMAGAVAKTTIAPLDRTKIIFQTSQTRFSVKNVLNVISTTVKDQGVLALWRGNSATMARIVPYAAIQFAAFEQLKKFLNPEPRNGPVLMRFLCGSLAGITAALCTYPLDLVRARMAVTQRGKYKGLLDAMQKIHNEEGTKKFYRGFVPTMLGIVPYAGLSFFTYETCKSTYKKWTDGSEPTSMHRMAFGACAGFVGQSTTYPLDIVRRRMQTDGAHGDVNPEYRTIISTLRSVFRNEGLSTGLYKGLSMNWVKGPIAVGISFTTYDFFHERLQTLFGRSQ